MRIAQDLATRVRLGEVHALCLMMMAVSEVLGDKAVITSGIDGKHMLGSKHFVGHALDFRTRDLSPASLDLVAKAIKERLSVDFDVILEENHLHVEWDPKA